MEQQYTVNGVKYTVYYKPELSTHNGTQEHVYHIYTEEWSFPKAHHAVEDIMGDDSWNIGYYKWKNDKEPSSQNYLHPYHKFEFNEELNCFVYKFIKPRED